MQHGGEVFDQAIAVEVRRQGGHRRAPQRRIAQCDRARGHLLEAAVRIVAHEVAHAGQVAAQARAELRLHRATPRQRIVGQPHRHRLPAIELQQGRLRGTYRYRWRHFLADLDAVARVSTSNIGSYLPRQRGHTGRHLVVPADFLRLPRLECELLRGQRLRAHPGRQRHVERGAGGVAHRVDGPQAVALAHQRWQAGEQHQVLRAAHLGLASAEQARLGAGDGDDAKRRERVVQWHLDRRRAVGVQRHLRLPEQQCVEQFAPAALAAAPASRHRLAAEVALAHHLHLGGGRLHLQAALLHHGVEQVPAGVGHQFQQPHIDRRQRHFGTRRRRRAVRARDPHLDLGLVAHLVHLPVGIDLHLQFIGGPAYPHRRDAKLVGRLAQVHQRGRLYASHATAHHQRRHIHIRCVTGLDRYREHRRAAHERAHVAVDHALALHRHQGGRRAERHPHLEAGVLARLVALVFGQQVDAVVVGHVEPPVVAIGHPGFAVGGRHALLRVLGLRAQDQVARRRRLDLADQQPLGVGAPFAGVAQRFHFAAVLVGVKAADQAAPVRGRFALEEVHGNRRIGHRLALQVEHHHLEFERVAAQHPAVGRDAHHHGRWPQAHAGGGGQGFAVGVLVRQLGRQFARHGHRRQLIDGDAGAASLVQRDVAGADSAAHGAAAFLVITVIENALVLVERTAAALHAHLHIAIAEGEVAVIVEAHRLVLHQGAQLHRRVTGAAAGQVAQLQIEIERRCLHRRRLGPLQQRLHGRHAELLDAEAASRAAANQHLVPALARVGRDLPVVGGAAVGAPGQRQFVALVAAFVDHEHAGRERLVRLEREAVHDLAALEVLHVHRFASAQQGAIEHRVGHHVVGAAVFGGQVEAPALDAAIPFRQGERHVGAVARADEQAFARFARGFRQFFGDVGHAVAVGRALPQQLAGAIAHGHPGASHRLALVERGDPHQRRLRAALEVRHQVGHQRGRADVRGPALAR